MGVIIEAGKFSLQDQTGNLKPIVYCCPYKGITENAISVNVELAQILQSIEPKKRTIQMERCLVKLLSKFPEEAVLKDFDVLFNPDYKVDVVKMMVNVCKVIPFCIIWPGTFDGSRLVYAEDGFRDYKTYNVNDYDITCIV